MKCYSKSLSLSLCLYVIVRMNWWMFEKMNKMSEYNYICTNDFREHGFWEKERQNKCFGKEQKKLLAALLNALKYHFFFYILQAYSTTRFCSCFIDVLKPAILSSLFYPLKDWRMKMLKENITKLISNSMVFYCVRDSLSVFS